ncbi:MAG: MotA/TolQ/ExbB proton channel family protein [Porphyrobacter sp.]|jgi:chemotaxis protein MotA|nr:MotA/TolQ/ExbB proton channel family protein [Porphyrobacter sp.]
MGSAGFSLLDAEAAAIVLGGTIIASLLVSGWGTWRCGVDEAAALLRPTFAEAANRAALARLIGAIDRHGRLAADAPLPPDPALAEMVAAYFRPGQVALMRERHQAQRAASRARCNAAVSAWRQAGELAPVAGLAGTLWSIAKLAPAAGTGGSLAVQAAAFSTASAIGTAVTSTLYGLMLAHLVCLPLAAAIVRRARAEQAVRQRLIGWFESQLPLRHDPRPHAAPAVLVEAA